MVVQSDLFQRTISYYRFSYICFMHRKHYHFTIVFFSLLMAVSRLIHASGWPQDILANRRLYRIPLAITKDFFRFRNKEGRFRQKLFLGKITAKKEKYLGRIRFRNAAFRLVHRISAFRGLVRSPLRYDLLFIRAYCLYEIHALDYWEFKNKKSLYLMQTAYQDISIHGFRKKLKNNRLRKLFQVVRGNIGSAYQNWLNPNYNIKTGSLCPCIKDKVVPYLRFLKKESNYMIRNLKNIEPWLLRGRLHNLDFHFLRLFEFNRLDPIVDLGRLLIQAVRSGKLLPSLKKQKAYLYYSTILHFYGASLFLQSRKAALRHLLIYLRTLPSVQHGNRNETAINNTGVLLLSFSGYLYRQRITGEKPSPEKRKKLLRLFSQSFFVKSSKPVGYLKNYLDALPKEERLQIIRLFWPKSAVGK